MTDWKRKLAAYLHDPPSKCLDIRTHGERSDAAFRQAGFVDTEVGEYFAHADHTGAAADRLPFPQSQAAGLACAFDGVRNTFRHPLSGDPLPFHQEFASAEQGFEGENSVQPKLTDESLAMLKNDDERWRARFFAHWRLWPKYSMEKDYRLALLPADTRIPDHNIWTHMQVVSALAGCVGPDKMWQPAFLKFQLGPVQDFIAAARSIRDLWSGSYLLSWLMAAGMKALSSQVGPDAIIFPNLREQPLFDLHWREELWSKVNIGPQGVWHSLGWTDQDLLTPNLPNVFLALVPAQKAAELAGTVKDAIEKEWQRIANHVWDACEQAGLTADEGAFSAGQRRERFDVQAQRFLSLSWQATPWPNTLEDALKMAGIFDKERPEKDMPTEQARARVQAVVEMAEKHMPVDHRDGRYYSGRPGGPKEKLNNIGLGWSVILALNGWELDAVRQTRAFAAANSGGWHVGTFSNKDVLTGREEAVAGGKKWGERARGISQGPWKSLFKHDDWVSAPTLIKRIWHFAYLWKEPWSLKTSFQNFPMPDTRSIARHDPFGRDDDPENEAALEQDASEKYFAVIAFDGDEIGKWVSGKKTPPFSTQLADYRDGSGNPGYGSKSYFAREEFGKFLQFQRPLSPSYHLQFSEALSNFALLCARPIVEAFDGRLIYAGGDDVLALLPADTALECAQALRMAFQGDTNVTDVLREQAGVLRNQHDAKRARDPKAADSPYYQKLAAEACLLQAKEPGFIRRLDQVDQQQHPIPFIVPGSQADCSVGIAIAHFKAPLQDVVRAAQAAEKRAKRKPETGGFDRKAAAVTLMKRSGEIIEWGAKWDGGLEFYRSLGDALESEELSAKFPHRFAELLEAYVTESTPLVAQSKTMQPVEGFSVDDIFRRELGHCLSRQRGPKFPKEQEKAEQLLATLRNNFEVYLKSLDKAGAIQPEKRLRFLIGLCQTVAFAHRTAAGSDTNLEPKGNA
jgi:CRISPR-associated protein Cmr2